LLKAAQSKFFKINFIIRIQDKRKQVKIQCKKKRKYSPLLIINTQSQAGDCFLEEKLKPRKKAATSLAVSKNNSGE
jgi:hypothetical protein